LDDCPPTHQILKEQVLSYKNRASWAEGRTRKAEDKFTDLEMLNATLTCQMQVRNWSYNLDSDNSLKKEQGNSYYVKYGGSHIVSRLSRLIVTDIFQVLGGAELTGEGAESLPYLLSQITERDKRIQVGVEAAYFRHETRLSPGQKLDLKPC